MRLRVFLLAAFVAAVILLALSSVAHGHLVTRPADSSLQARERSQQTNLAHSKYVCARGANANRRWHCTWVRILARELARTRAALNVRNRRLSDADARARNIGAAMQVYAEQCSRVSGHCDPWPNCPDPYDRRGSWDATKDCESRGYPWTVGRLAGYCGPLQLHLTYWAHVIRRWRLPC